MNNNLSKLIEIYSVFFKLGSISFGGGYAMIPLIEREVVEEKKWLDKERVIDIFAVAESLPGAIGINSSALVGFSVKGIPGALAATLGNITPSVIIVLILSILFVEFSTYAVVQSAFNGIRPAIIGLISYAAYKIGKTAIKDFTCIVIMILAFCAIMFFKVHPIIIIVSGAICGLSIVSVKAALAAGQEFKRDKKEGM